MRAATQIRPPLVARPQAINNKATEEAERGPLLKSVSHGAVLCRISRPLRRAMK